MAELARQASAAVPAKAVVWAALGLLDPTGRVPHAWTRRVQEFPTVSLPDSTPVASAMVQARGWGEANVVPSWTANNHRLRPPPHAHSRGGAFAPRAAAVLSVDAMQASPWGVVITCGDDTELIRADAAAVPALARWLHAVRQRVPEESQRNVLAAWNAARDIPLACDGERQ